jgi:hypothetical protein
VTIPARAECADWAASWIDSTTISVLCRTRSGDATSTRRIVESKAITKVFDNVKAKENVTQGGPPRTIQWWAKVVQEKKKNGGTVAMTCARERDVGNNNVKFEGDGSFVYLGDACGGGPGGRRNTGRKNRSRSLSAPKENKPTLTLSRVRVNSSMLTEMTASLFLESSLRDIINIELELVGKEC